MAIMASGETGVAYVVDLALPCRAGALAIALDDRPAPAGALEAIVEAVRRLGGTVSTDKRMMKRISG